MKTLKEAVIVEGRYDCIKLQSILNATVIPTNGFRIFSDPEKRALLKKLAAERGLVILTDSDRGGFRIRGYLRGIVPEAQVKHAYIPELSGKEKRKEKAGAEGLLGVEGMPPEVILAALEQAGCTFDDAPPKSTGAFTRTRLYEDGLMGQKDSASRREAFLRELHLPRKMTVPALLHLLNAGYDEEAYTQALKNSTKSFQECTKTASSFCDKIKTEG